MTPPPRSRRAAKVVRPAMRTIGRPTYLSVLSGNASAVTVLFRNAPDSVAEIVERAEELATGEWIRVGVAVNPAISVKIADGYVDLVVEWPNVTMMTEGARIIVSVKTATIPVTVAVAVEDRIFSDLAGIAQLRELYNLRIGQVLSGDITTIVTCDERVRTLVAA